MMFLSAPFLALMRRNLLYRRRYVIATFLEVALPVLFAGLLLMIKTLADDSDTFAAQEFEDEFTSHLDVMKIPTFSDYVTAIVAQRVCTTQGFGNNEFDISGMPRKGYDWQIPFVKCDSRRCEYHGQDAYDFCLYPILAVAPDDNDDVVGRERMDDFVIFLNNRFPQLADKNLTHFPNDYEFVRKFGSSDEISEYVQQSDYGSVGKEQIGLAITFGSGSDLDFAYSIRVNSTNYNAPEAEARPGTFTTPNTNRIFSSFAKKDNACMPLPGTATQGALENSCTGQYIYNGFLAVQRLVQDWIIEASGAKEAGSFVSEHGVRYVKFPSKAYTTEGFYSELARYMPLLMTLGILYPCAAMVSYIVQEKELRQKELMKMCGVTEAVLGWSWFLTFFMLHVFTATFVSFISSSLFDYSDPVLLFFFWQLCFLGFAVLSLLVSTFVSKTTRGVLIDLLVVFGGYFLTEIENVNDGSLGAISLISIHPVAAMAYALQEVGRLEDARLGVRPDTIGSTDAPSGYTFSAAYGNLILSVVVLSILTWYLNRVIPPAYGQSLPIWFPFTRAYWWPSSVKHKEYDEANREEDVDNDLVPLEPVQDMLKQQIIDGEAVEVRNLSKDFGEKVAVDGLNLTMYKDQVTALLGHNGAGKTTAIAMLTGALSPTSGTAFVAGKDIRTDMNSIRDEIGICLQHDCLFPKLTVREHVQFFSRLKGIYRTMSFSDAEASVTQAIRDVALEEKSNTFSRNLSGGMKRKLSVAMAFCGGSKVVFLDEPTSGMDPFARRFTWDVIRQYKKDRCIILTTHFMDEADILGDRIAIMSEGRLRCCGSSLFLKRTYGVGYQLTIEKQSKLRVEKTKADGVPAGTSDDDLKSIVLEAVSEASLLSNVGTQMIFQLPIGASHKFVPMLERLDKETEAKSIQAYGVSITTLDEVFLLVARGDEATGAGQSFKSSYKASAAEAGSPADNFAADIGRVLEEDNLFGAQVTALLKKRGANFKRDKKAWCCTTVVPSLFVLIGLLLLKYATPDRNLVPLRLEMDGYNEGIVEEDRNPIPFNNGPSFTCNPGFCTQKPRSVRNDETGEEYFFCGGDALVGDTKESCTLDTLPTNVMDQVYEDGALGIGDDVRNISESSRFIFDTSYNYSASLYGGVFFSHFMNSTIVGNNVSYGQKVSQECADSLGEYVLPSECERYGTGISYTVSYNFTALHSAPLFQMLADESIIRNAVANAKFKISATIHPLPKTALEQNYDEADDSFVLWFLVVLSFPFIAGAFATFVVRERESKAKHLQTVAGVKPAVYWVSTLLWDMLNYLIPFVSTIILIFAFDAKVFTTSERNALSGTVCLLLLFGPAAAALAYCFSFMFKSPSLCNIVIIISGFLIGMGASIAVLVLEFIGLNPFEPRPNLLNVAKGILWVGRFFPTFCLGKGLLYVINIEAYAFLLGKDLDAWSSEVLLVEAIFLAAESVVYLLLAICLDILSSNPEAMLCWQRTFGCRKASEKFAVALPDDDDVVAEEQRVINGQADDEAIVIKELSKVYSNGKVAVDKFSLGIPPGECFGLLGINGAGKTSLMSVLTAELAPTLGDAILAGFSLRDEPEKTRRKIGYCPQFDAHFDNMTGREHVELYASIKGVPRKLIKEAVAKKLAQVGLEDKDCDRLSSNYSGGMKRRLSLAIATIGQPELVFLDECSTGVDPVARRDIWQMVSDIVSESGQGHRKTSVVLTTHSMEECEALCPRIGIMAVGKLRCLGSAQHLKTKFGKGFQVELKVKDVAQENEDFRKIALILARAKQSDSVSDEEAILAEPNIVFNLEEAQTALQQLTSDDYLSCMLNQGNPTGQGIYKEAIYQGVQLRDLATFAANELRMRDLHSIIMEQYPSAILRERQGQKARFEVCSENMSIAHIFASVEENKERLRLADYGVSQTSLEQVFNMHAAEAEKLKHGRMDN